jgi:stage IV sporulation protein FB
MFYSGYYTIGHFKGAPIRIHWSAPLGALVLGGFRFVPGFWVAFILLIFFHELGHAVVVRACRQRITGIDIHGLGGQCRWEGTYLTSMKRALIAWGGVWAQLIILIATYAVITVLGPGTNPHVWDAIDAFTRGNLWLIAINLVPIAPLDGAEAWPLFRLLWERWKLRRQIRVSAKPIVRLVPKPEPKPEEPKYSDRVRDPKKSEELFKRLMSNNPLEEDKEER